MRVSYSRLKYKWVVWDDNGQQLGMYENLRFEGVNADFVMTEPVGRQNEKQGWIDCEGTLVTDGDSAVIAGVVE